MVKYGLVNDEMIHVLAVLYSPLFAMTFVTQVTGK